MDLSLILKSLNSTKTAARWDFDSDPKLTHTIPRN